MHSVKKGGSTLTLNNGSQHKKGGGGGGYTIKFHQNQKHTGFECVSASSRDADDRGYGVPGGEGFVAPHTPEG